ncbi:MAG: hypothetical protein ABMA25_11820, partial [Ilumatobacteraceae bacterium]
MDSVGHDPLRAKLSTVVDEATFLEFLAALAMDRHDEVTKESPSPSSSPWGPGPNGWEHGTIENYLDAAASWGAEGIGIVADNSATNPWQRCAEILWA